MIKAAIVEDEKMFVDKLEELLNKWGQYNGSVSVSYYATGDDLFYDPGHINDFDIVFLDIELGNNNGVEIAKKMRQTGYQNLIVFTTNYQVYIHEGYEVRAFRFLLKPVSYNDVAACMNEVLSRNLGEAFKFSYKNIYNAVPFKDIVFIGGRGHYIDIVTGGKTYVARMLIKEALELVPAHFMRCRRDTIVNMHYVRKLVGTTLFLKNDTVLDIGEKYLHDIRQEISRYS